MIKSLKYKVQNFSTYFITWFFGYDNNHQKCFTFLVPKRRGKLFWKVYVYFRWVDDIVDDMKISQDYKRKFLKQQRKFLDSVYNSKKVNLEKLNYEEKGLYDVIKLYWNHKKAKEFKKHIYNMMWTFDYDVGRIGKHIKEKEFMKYSKYIGGAYAFVFMLIWDISKYEKKYNSITKKEMGKTLKQLAENYAHYCHLIHTLRDFDEDMKKGYINIPYGKEKNKYLNYIKKVVIPAIDRFASEIDKYIDNKTLKIVLNLYLKRFKKAIRIIKIEGFRQDI
jgi:phytoene/squalene synthetase